MPLGENVVMGEDDGIEMSRKDTVTKRGAIYYKATEHDFSIMHISK